MQRPDATQVAGFQSWLRLGRHVRKGKKGVAIFAPIVNRVHAEDPDTGEETVITTPPKTFRVAYVFDVARPKAARLLEASASKERWNQGSVVRDNGSTPRDPSYR